MNTETRIVSVERRVAAPAENIFELIADPAKQPQWDGNDNLAHAIAGQRVTAVGDVFSMELTGTLGVRENHAVEFEEGRRIAWLPSPVGQPTPPGHLWRWEVEPQADGTAIVRHTFDWSALELDETFPQRFERARNTTPAMLRASLDRLAELAESLNR